MPGHHLPDDTEAGSIFYVSVWMVNLRRCENVGVLVYFLISEKLAEAWKVKRREAQGRQDSREWRKGQEEGGQRVALVSFFGHKALPSDTCHWLGINSLSVWQEVKASKQKLKGWVYTRGGEKNSQRKWVLTLSVWRPDENGTCFPHSLLGDNSTIKTSYKIPCLMSRLWTHWDWV